jgi:hypothetical protein
MKRSIAGRRGGIASLALTAAMLFVASGSAGAHHSTAMYDAANPIELAGTVLEWQFGNPHCVIMLEVEVDGEKTVWTLEGMSPNVLFRQGWRPDSLKPGDRLIATVNPLHSGAPVGNYSNVRWADGTPVDPTAGRPE